MGQLHLFGTQTQLEKLSKLGDPLTKANELINWEIFRDPIEKAIRNKDKNKGGRPPYDAILMFKITILQQWYGLSDMSVEYQINDRLTFMRFLNLEAGDKVPDGNTIWDFKEALKTNNLGKKLFDTFNLLLEEKGIITHKGSIVDATFVTVPVRHTTKKDDKCLKNGEELKDLPVKCAKRLENGEIKNKDNVVAQMDLDARWTKKGSDSFFGYKDHVKCDSESKIIIDYCVTDASVHDSQVVVGLIDEKDRDVKLDCGYVGGFRDEILKLFPDARVCVCSRAFRNRSLTDEEKAGNRVIARVRCRVEHVFGYMTRFMGGITCRVHGFLRVGREVGFKNLAYNLRRFMFIVGC